MERAMREVRTVLPVHKIADNVQVPVEPAEMPLKISPVRSVMTEASVWVARPIQVRAQHLQKLLNVPCAAVYAHRKVEMAAVINAN
jgi:hypothetical protein